MGSNIELSIFSTIGVFGDGNASCSTYLMYLMSFHSKPSIYDVVVATSRKLNAIGEVSVLLLHTSCMVIHMQLLISYYDNNRL